VQVDSPVEVASHDDISRFPLASRQDDQEREPHPLRHFGTLTQPEKTQDGNDDDDCADEVNDAVHKITFRMD
jgi:hypothetical protein